MSNDGYSRKIVVWAMACSVRHDMLNAHQHLVRLGFYMSSFNLVKQKARYKHAPVVPLVRLTHGAHHGPNFNLISEREWVRKQTQSSNCHWKSKLKFAMFDECFLKSCGVWVTHKLLSFCVFKAIINSAQKLSTQNGDFVFASLKNGNLRVIFVWLRSFVCHICCQWKVLQVQENEFCIFPEVGSLVVLFICL